MKLFKALAAVAMSAALLVGGAATASAATEGIAGTDAPVKIRVGAPYMEIPITVVTRAPAESMSVSLVHPRFGPSLFDYASGPQPGRPNVFKITMAMYDWEVEAWGAHRWDFDGYRTTSSQFIEISSSVNADMRAHSMLGLATSRSGSSVTVKGSLRAYHNGESRYVAWSGRPVSVQRYNGSAWVQVAGARTNSQGDVNLRVAVPSGSPLRLVAGDTGATWGAVSRTVTR